MNPEQQSRVWREIDALIAADEFEPKPLRPSTDYRRVSRWTPVQVGIYIVVPVATAIGYALAFNWLVGRTS